VDRVRLVPRLRLPRYRYVPGLQTHPFRNPDGHAAPEDDAFRTHRDWWRDERYLYGVDLVNARFFWEAHEVWEGRWRDLAADDVERFLLQGLIQGAASRLKRHMGQPRQAERLWTRAQEHLGRVRAAVGTTAYGLDLDDVVRTFARDPWPSLTPTLPLESP
jgi:hypothetical protein